MKQISRLLILFACVCICDTLRAQGIKVDLPSVTYHSPEAASVVKYANYPVDYSTGIPDIKIPIYEIQEGELTLPIYLSYHASGLKPHDGCGWVGTGWTLFANPSVVRSIKGLPDDLKGEGYMYISRHYDELTNGEDQKNHLSNMLKGLIDEEPDQFSYRLADGGGSFYANEQRDFVAHPYRALSISGFLRNQFDYFDIKNEKGWLYHFGDGSNYQVSGNSGECVNEWLCNYIKSPISGKQIDFTYQQNKFKTSFGSTMNDIAIINDRQVQKGPTLTEKSSGFSRVYNLVNGEKQYVGSSFDGISVSSRYSSRSTFVRYLSQITFGNGKILFYMNEEDHESLQSIEVYDKANNLIKKINFYITPYNENTPLTKLNSITIEGQDTELASYVFEYNAIAGVPDLATKGVDHWGYYNGEQNIFTVPQGKVQYEEGQFNVRTVDLTIDGAKRESTEAMKYGVLYSVESPEGTLTTFTYDVNKIENYYQEHLSDPEFRLVGGLRISKIEVTDLLTKREVRTRYISYFDESFERALNITDYGVPKRAVSLNDYGYYQNKIELSSVDTKRSRMQIYCSTPLTAIAWKSGSSVLYRCVVEHEYSALTNEDQYTKYNYDIPDFSPNEVKGEMSYIPVRRNMMGDDYLIGMLEKKEVFAPAKKGHMLIGRTPIETTEYKWGSERFYLTNALEYHKYNSYNKSNRITFGQAYCIASVSGNVGEYDMNSCINENTRYTSWYDVANVMKLQKETHTLYSKDGKSIVDTQEYAYDPCAYDPVPKKIITTKSDGTVCKEIFKYPEDIVVREQEGNDPDLGPMENFEDLGAFKLMTDHRMTELLEHIIIDGDAKTTYRTKYISGQPKEMKVKTSGMNDFETRVKYHNYDPSGNPVYITKDDSTKVVYLWLRNGQFPIAEIHGATYTEVDRAVKTVFGVADITALSQQDTLQDEKLRNGGLQHALPHALVTTYTYQQLVGMTSVTDPRGTTTYYTYDTLGRLKEIYIVEGGVKKVVESYEYHYGKQ